LYHNVSTNYATASASDDNDDDDDGGGDKLSADSCKLRLNTGLHLLIVGTCMGLRNASVFFF
jgi:hypothetical protein